MKATLLLLTTLLLQLGADGSPLTDLCTLDPLRAPTGEVMSDSGGTTLARYCQWTGPDAPAWDDLACCSLDEDSATCVSSEGRESCGEGFDPYYCEHGIELDGGGLLCLQSFPSACDNESCMDEIPTALLSDDAIQEGVLCCQGGACVNWHGKVSLDCEGHYFWCHAGYTNEDGTTDCFDASTEP